MEVNHTMLSNFHLNWELLKIDLHGIFSSNLLRYFTEYPIIWYKIAQEISVSADQHFVFLKEY